MRAILPVKRELANAVRAAAPTVAGKRAKDFIMYERLRAFAHRQLGPHNPGQDHLTAANILVVTVILVSLVMFTLESDPDYRFKNAVLLSLLTIVTLAVFTIEFFARVFAAGHELQYRGFVGRLRFLRDNWFLLTVDLLAFAPELIFLLAGLPPPSWLRTLRVVRIIKLARYMSGVALIFEAVRESARELATAVSVAIVLWYMGSVALYMAERNDQPEGFGSIPDAMWWAVVTMTTVGYGEVVPQTNLGKVLAGFLMLLALGVVALPSGILAGSFMHRYRERQKAEEDIPED